MANRHHNSHQSSEDKYPRVTQDQVDIWLTNPCTIALVNVMNESLIAMDEQLTDIGINQSNEDIANEVIITQTAKKVYRNLSNLDHTLSAMGMVEER